jgi:hypothetical protein
MADAITRVGRRQHFSGVNASATYPATYRRRFLTCGTADVTLLQSLEGMGVLSQGDALVLGLGHAVQLANGVEDLSIEYHKSRKINLFRSTHGNA